MLLTMRYNCWQVGTHCMALDLIFNSLLLPLCAIFTYEYYKINYSLVKEITQCGLVISLGA